MMSILKKTGKHEDNATMRIRNLVLFVIFIAECICVTSAMKPWGQVTSTVKSSWFRSKSSSVISELRNAFQYPIVKTANSSNRKKKVLILMSDTGGGHRASAEALDQAMQVKYPGQLKVDIVDLWTEHGMWPFSKFVSGYRYLCKHPQLWRSFYNFGSFPPCKILVETISRIGCYSRFHTAIRQHDPDLVVSVHPFCQDIPISIVTDLNRHRSTAGKGRIPFVTVVTDLGSAHSCWFDKRVDCCYVPSECLFNCALKRGLTSSQVKRLGLPIRPAFWSRPQEDKRDIRRSLSLDADLMTVLLMGGGDGVGGLQPIVMETVNHLRRERVPAQLVVVCGRNGKMLTRLRACLPPSPAAAECLGPRVHLLSFVDNVDRYMAASDLVVSKAGPGTIAEAMTRGLPMILSSFLPGQEAGNVPFVVNSGFGIYTGNRPKLISRSVHRLLSNDTLRSEMSSRALQCAQPHSALDIAQDIGGLLTC